jgi:hypothetical protein
MDYKVTVSQTGRGGTIFYHENEAELSFDWEFSMTGATVFVPTPQQWENFCKTRNFPNGDGRRQEVLENLGTELCRQQTSNGTFEISDNWLEIIF